MIPQAELRARVVMTGVKKANSEAMSFHGVLKDISGESAEASLKANYDGRGFDEFKAAMTDAKLRAAKPIVQEARLKYDKGEFSDLRREIFLTRKAMSGLGSEHGIGSALAGAVMPFGKIGTAALVASPQVLTLAGSVTAVGGSLVGAAEGAGALGIALGGMATVGLGGIIAIAVPAVASLKALTEAQKSYIAAVETYGVQSTQAETAGKKLLAAEKSSGKEAVGLVKNMDQVKERWADITKPGREAFLGGLSDAIDRVDKKLPLLGDSANRSAKVGREGFDQFLDQVTGSDFDKFVKTMTSTEENVIPELSHATGDWGQILERVATDAAPSLEKVAGIFTHWSNEVLGSTDNSHKLSGEIEHLTGDFMDWVHLLGASGSLLHDIFDAGEGSGNELVVDTTKQFNEWSEWIEHHGPKVEAFFTETKEGVEVLASILGHVGQDWFVMSQAMEPVEELALHILDDFAKIHIGGQSMLTYLLGGFALLKVAVAAVKIKDLAEGVGWLKTLTQQASQETEIETGALQAQADAASAAAAANADLAASNQAVADSAQLGMLETGPVADAEKAGQQSMFPMGGGVVPMATEAERGAPVGTSAKGGSLAAKLGLVGADGIATTAGLATAGVGTVAITAAMAIIHPDKLGENPSHEKELHLKGLEFNVGSGKSEAQFLALEKGFGHTMDKLRSDAAVGMGAINAALGTGLQQANETWANGTPKWREHTAEAMHSAVKEIRQGMAAQTIDAKEGQREINQILTQLHLKQGSDPFGLAAATTKQFKQLNEISAAGVSSWTRKLEQMPPAARKQTLLATEGMLSAWAQGHPKLEAQVSNLVSKETEVFGHGASQMVAQSAGAMQGVTEAFGSGADNVRKAIGNIMENMSAALAAEGSGAHPNFSLKVLSAASTYHNLREKTQSGLGRQEGGFLVGGSGSGDRPGFMGEPKGFVLNRNATSTFGFAKGGMIPLALEPGERYFSPPEVQQIGAHNLASMNSSVKRQNGGALGPEPLITGPSGSLRTMGQEAIRQVHAGAADYLAAHKPKGGGNAEYVGGGGPVAAQMWKSLSASGYNKIGAAGVIGNAGQESGLNPGAVGSGGGGLLGFTSGAISLASLQAFAKAQGKPWDDVGLQMQFFLDHESGIRSGVNSQPNAAVAAKYFMENWERPYVPTENLAHREEVARWAFAQGYRKGGAVTPTVGPQHRPKWLGWTPDGRYAPGTSTAQHLITGGEALAVPTNISPTPSTTQVAAEKATKEAESATKSRESKSTPTNAVHWEMSHLGDSDQWGYPGEWCGAFQAAAMEAVDIKPPSGFASAASWANFGTPLGRGHVQAGAILDYGSAHVAMAISSSEQIQGNDQNGQVGTSGIGGIIGGSGLTAVRWPPYEGTTGPGAGAAPVEKVPASFNGLATAQISIGSSTPKSIHGIQREEARRKREKHAYEQALTAAAGRPKLVAALQHNVTALTTRLEQLRKAASKVRREIAEKRFTAKLGRGYGKVTDYGQKIEARQRDYAEKSELAEHLVGLEPTEPIMAQEVLPANATEAEQLAAEKKRQGREEAYVSELTGYIHGKVEPAYMGVLASEASWRDTILSGELAATVFESGAEGHVRKLESRISAINAYTEQVGQDEQKLSHDVATYRSNHPTGALPDWIQTEQTTVSNEEKRRDKMRAHLPLLRFKEAGWRETLGEARGNFYGGYAEGVGVAQVHPPNPPLAGTGEFEQALIEVQGTKWPKLHERIKVLPVDRDALGLGGAIWDTQTQMSELGLQVAQANASVSPAASGGLGGGEGEALGAAATGPTQAETEHTELIEGLLREANQEKAINASLGPVLKQFEQSYPVGSPYMGAFEKGGVALVGEKGPELVGLPNGTRVHSNRDSERMLGRGDLHVVVNGDIHQKPGDTRDPIEVLERDPRFERLVHRVTGSKQRPVVTTGAPRAFR
jgi:hypothetical protein